MCETDLSKPEVKIDLASHRGHNLQMRSGITCVLLSLYDWRPKSFHETLLSQGHPSRVTETGFWTQYIKMLSQREFNPPPQLAQNRKHQLQQHLRGLLLPEQIHDQHRVVEKFNQPPQPLTFPLSPPQSRELCVFPTFPASCTGKPLKRRIFT